MSNKIGKDNLKVVIPLNRAIELLALLDLKLGCNQKHGYFAILQILTFTVKISGEKFCARFQYNHVYIKMYLIQHIFTFQDMNQVKIQTI